MESWRKVFREGFAPLVSDEGLEALRLALANDDVRLIQGATTSPPPLAATQDFPVDAACLIGYTGWQGDGLETVGEVEEYFARMCWSIEESVGNTTTKGLLNWYDETPRDEMRRLLLEEVLMEQSRRAAEEAAMGGLVEEVV